MISVAEFWASYAGQPYQLINGRVARILQAEYVHEMVVNRVQSCLEVYTEPLYLGVVVGAGVRFALSEYDLRAVDVAFISAARLEGLQDPEQFLPFPPDLLVEVVSSRYTSTQIQAKAELFLDAGTALVWVVDPSLKTVTVFYPNGAIEILSGDDHLDGYHIVPGFSLAVADFFPPLDVSFK